MYLRFPLVTITIGLNGFRLKLKSGKNISVIRWKNAFVGIDVTDQLAYLHEPGNPVKFLDVGDDVRLTTL
jgi:hypothetical protein